MTATYDRHGLDGRLEELFATGLLFNINRSAPLEHKKARRMAGFCMEKFTDLSVELRRAEQGCA
jgi:hypothetical protein